MVVGLGSSLISLVTIALLTLNVFIERDKLGDLSVAGLSAT